MRRPPSNEPEKDTNEQFYARLTETMDKHIHCHGVIWMQNWGRQWRIWGSHRDVYFPENLQNFPTPLQKILKSFPIFTDFFVTPDFFVSTPHGKIRSQGKNDDRVRLMISVICRIWLSVSTQKDSWGNVETLKWHEWKQDFVRYSILKKVLEMFLWCESHKRRIVGIYHNLLLGKIKLKFK